MRRAEYQHRSFLSLWLVATISLALAGPLGFWSPAFGQFKFQDQLFDPSSAGSDQERLSVSAQFRVAEGTNTGQLSVTAKMAPGWHVYSLTNKDIALPSKITVSPSDQFQLIGKFKADRDPHIRDDKVLKARLEEYYDEVTWSAPIRLGAKNGTRVDPSQLKIAVEYEGQLCHDEVGCLPPKTFSLTAGFSGYSKPASPSGEYAPKDAAISWKGWIEPAVVAPGGKAYLKITATPQAPYFIYAENTQAKSSSSSSPTLIVLTKISNWKAGKVVPSESPVAKETGLEDEPIAFIHRKPVTWTIELTAPEDASPGQYDLAGLIGFQTCTDKICLPPSGAKFEGAVTVGQAIQQGKVPLAFQKGDYSLAAKEAKRQFQNQDSETGQAKQIAGDADAFFANLKPTKVEYSFIWALLFAFAGGFLLNFMPCVLPVIGLKVMAFVQQAGENRARVFWLNFWYAAGMMSIFLVVATLVVVFNFGLGQWLQTTAFRVTLTAIMFAMGLSFLGVWEIPIPGFVGAGGAGKLAAQEGPVGAFSKGVLTTILGTACTGPGIASAFAWCSGKPAFLVYAVFVFMGLGMVFPYLAIGVRPQLIRFLPKPGAWMETFKQIMGFVLLATVVLLLTFLHMTMVIPTIAVLFAVWAACWWTARTAYNADLHAKVRSWCGACALVAIVVMFSFGWLYGEMERRFAGAVEAEMAKHGQETPELVSQLAWKPYSKQKLHSLLTDGKTVMVDFTADWCMTCKLLEATVLNTQSIKEQIEKNGVETLVADWTERGPEIGNTLVNLGGGKQVPTLAIFPASRPDSPIVITGLYTKAQLLKKLEEAGPSQTLTASPEASSPKAASLARAPK